MNGNTPAEAVKSGRRPQQPDTLGGAGPCYVTMLENGLKDEGGEGVRVKDTAEVVAETLV